MALLSSKVLPGGGSVVAWARDDGGRHGGDFVRVEMCYRNHSQEEPSEPMMSEFELQVGSDDLDEVHYSYYVCDTVCECLDDLGVDLPMRPAAMDAVAEGLWKLLHRGISAVLVVVVEVGESPEAVKALLAASGVVSLTRGGGSGGCCAICQDDVAKRESRDEDEVEVGRLPCSHEFHADCLVRWVIKCHAGGGFPSCPLCRCALSLS